MSSILLTTLSASEVVAVIGEEPVASFSHPVCVRAPKLGMLFSSWSMEPKPVSREIPFTPIHAWMEGVALPRQFTPRGRATNRNFEIMSPTANVGD